MKKTFKIGDKVQSIYNKRQNGEIIEVSIWNNPNGYKGLVYSFKDGNGRTYFGYQGTELVRT